MATMERQFVPDGHAPYASALMYLIGTELDYVEDKMSSSFVFRNPNEKGRCGCGESFHV